MQEQDLEARLKTSAVVYVVGLAAVVAATNFGLWPGVDEPGEGFWTHPYRLSMAVVTLFLATYLGLWSGAVGSLRRNTTFGLGVLCVGGVLTGTALWMTPWILFPQDRYSVAMMWLFAGAPMGLIAWAGVMVGRGLRQPS